MFIGEVEYTVNHLYLFNLH